MKIGITGHTTGIGKQLFENYGYKGWSLSNGYDLQDPDIRQKVVEEAHDVDVFINNADNGKNLKLDVFKTIWNAWKDKPKILVSIGSFKQVQVLIDSKIYCSDGWTNTIAVTRFWETILPAKSELAVGLIEFGPVGSERTIRKKLPFYSSLDEAETIIMNTVEQLAYLHRIKTQVICKGYHA
jgi:hypothetical protein|tara:strand:+ start:2507 stop:3052 length:546 start_codon:yes stop_codon:yes gene_type:complete